MKERRELLVHFADGYIYLRINVIYFQTSSLYIHSVICIPSIKMVWCNFMLLYLITDGMKEEKKKIEECVM